MGAAESKSTESEIRRITDALEPSIVVEAAYAGMVSEQQARRVWLCDAADALPGRVTFAALCAQHANAPTPQIDLPLDATQAIKFTGGTTGAAKGVMQPYRAWMANIVNQIHAWEITEHDRYVMAAPIMHGTSTYVLPILSQDTFLHRGGTMCFMPPTLVYMLMGLPGASRTDYPQLRRLIYGGASMPPEKVRAVRDFFGPVLGTTYGQTEAPQILTVMRP